MKKIFRKIHLWLSIPAGLLISLICLTGAVLVFEKEIKELGRSGYRFAQVQGDTPLPVGTLLHSAAGQLGDSLKIMSVSVFADPSRCVVIGVKGHANGEAYVDPYDGTVLHIQWRNPNDFFAQVRNLHRWLMFKGKAASKARLVVGYATMLLVVILLTGLIVWWPKNRRQLKARTRIRGRSGWRWFWYDLHVSGGFFAMLLLLAMALTGMTYSISWYRSVFYKTFGAEVSESASPEKNTGEPISDNQSRSESPSSGNPVAENPPESIAQASEAPKQKDTPVQEVSGQPVTRETKRPVDRYAVWAEVCGKLSNVVPDYQKITVQSGSAVVSDNTFPRSSRRVDRYSYDNKTGALKNVRLFADQPRLNKLRTWIYSVHVGEWGGFVSKCIYFMAALLGGLLPITGYYLYIKRLIAKRRK